MSEYLVDTNVISELMKVVPNECALNWMCEYGDGIRLSSVTIKELFYGAIRMKEGKRKTSLLTRIESVTSFYGEDIIPFDAQCAIACARLHALAISSGRTPTIEDLMIAATALVHDIPVATRNVKDFDYLGVACVNPFEYEDGNSENF